MLDILFYEVVRKPVAQQVAHHAPRASSHVKTALKAIFWSTKSALSAQIIAKPVTKM